MKRLARSRHHKTMSATRMSPRLLAGLALLVVLLGPVACRRSPEVAATPKPPAVTVVAAAQLRVPVYGQYIGQTEAVKTVEARARVEGVIDPRPFEVALRQAQANVARDIAQLRQTEAALVQREAEVRQAQANLDRDLAQLDNARTQEQRYRTLLQKELIAGEQYDQLRTNMTALDATVQADRAALENTKAALAASRAAIENARAAVRADEAAADSARLQLGYTSIKSPPDVRQLQRERTRGTVGVEPSASGDAGEAELLRHHHHAVRRQSLCA